MKDVAVFIPSYDGYSDIWPITANLFSRFWPDRQWPMYWMTNGKTVPEIATPLIVPRTGWSEWGVSTALAVSMITEPLVLHWHEEVFPLSKVPNDLFLEAAEILRTTPDVGIVQLTHYYFRPTESTLGNFADFPRTTAGFSAAMPALFRKEVLLHLVRTLLQPNDFEQQSAAVMLRDLPNVRSLASCKPLFSFCDNGLIGGVWRRCAVQHLKELGFTIDYSLRGIAGDDCRFMEGTPA